MCRWIAGRIAEILGTEDDIVTELCFNLLEGERFVSHSSFQFHRTSTYARSMQPNIKVLQIQLTGFLDKDTASFCKELWSLCLSAQANPQGVPKELLEAKKLELIQEKVSFWRPNLNKTCELMPPSLRQRRPPRQSADNENKIGSETETWTIFGAGRGVRGVRGVGAGEGVGKHIVAEGTATSTDTLPGAHPRLTLVDQTLLTIAVHLPGAVTHMSLQTLADAASHQQHLPQYRDRDRVLLPDGDAARSPHHVPRPVADAGLPVFQDQHLVTESDAVVASLGPRLRRRERRMLAHHHPDAHAHANAIDGSRQVYLEAARAPAVRPPNVDDTVTRLAGVELLHRKSAVV